MKIPEHITKAVQLKEMQKQNTINYTKFVVQTGKQTWDFTDPQEAVEFLQEVRTGGLKASLLRYWADGTLTVLEFNK